MTPRPDMPAGLAALLGRASVPPRLLRGPGPDAGALALAVAAALRAPDQGGLRPWRFVAIEGAGREALGQVLEASLARREPDAGAERLAMERARPLRAPLVVAAGARLQPGHRIPLWEQEASGAAGIMNFLHAMELQAFGAMWVSGPALRDPVVKEALGFAAEDALLGWLYVGTPPQDRPRPVRPAPEGFWRRWPGG